METPDDYERRYMDADRAILRARHRLPRWFPLAMLATLALVVSQFAVVLGWLWAHLHQPGVKTVFALMAAHLAFTVVAGLLGVIVDHVTRVVLTPSHLRVHRGLWSDDIPIAAIERVAVEDVSAWLPKASLIAMFLRRERDYMAFGMREALRVEWRNDEGRKKTTWVRFEAAAAFLARIEGLRAAPTGVRAALDDGAGEGAEASDDEVDAGGATKRAAR